MSTQTTNVAAADLDAKQMTLNMLSGAGITGADCLSAEELRALGDLTLNELKGLFKAQQALPGPLGGGMCGGKIF